MRNFLKLENKNNKEILKIIKDLFLRLTGPEMFGGYFYLQGNENPEIALLHTRFCAGQRKTKPALREN